MNTMNSQLEQLSIREKALKLSLLPTNYGVFAEIGAGQEVVNHFFNAGAASGTITKAISACDMTSSDSVYDEMQKYVSANVSRVCSMLNSMISPKIFPILDYQTQLIQTITPIADKPVDRSITQDGLGIGV
jgi:hypothetical protein